jgi:ribose 5-phosphate isomerase A
VLFYISFGEFSAMKNSWKLAAAERASELVERGMIVGLGSGTTMFEVVRCLAKLGVKASFVPASLAVERLASKLGLRLTDLGKCPTLDLHLDGADEVDPWFNLIKGRGGALTREKILARASERVVIVVDRTKLVRKLGERSPVPVEVLPFAAGLARRRLAKYGKVELRRRARGRPYLTDNGNYIFDVRCGLVEKPRKRERELNAVPGVVENGIFVGLVDWVVVGHGEGVNVIKSKRKLGKLIRRPKTLKRAK